MAGAKETPRQKMIGMMYLVLTALLALNISKEILNGFVKVENGLRKTDQTVQSQSRETMLEFEAKYLQDQQKVKPYYDAAKDIDSKANALYDHITQLKANIMAVASNDRELVDTGGRHVQVHRTGQVDPSRHCSEHQIPREEGRIPGNHSLPRRW